MPPPAAQQYCPTTTVPVLLDLLQQQSLYVALVAPSSCLHHLVQQDFDVSATSCCLHRMQLVGPATCASAPVPPLSKPAYLVAIQDLNVHVLHLIYQMAMKEHSISMLLPTHFDSDVQISWRSQKKCGNEGVIHSPIK